ncbi:MAG: PDZ domain-containing protein [Proteobacteria bacterium]|nr:PDZ domain-containing protein [Pseudomonadota bacterium]
MTEKKTLRWRSGLLGLLLALTPVAVLTYEHYTAVDTDVMLNVSVSIRTISHVRIDKVGDSVWESGSGSGYLVASGDCEVWTNHHVIADAAVIEVFPRGWTRASGIRAEVVNATPRYDVAILRMEHCEGISEARLGDSSKVAAGDETYAVGNPLGRNPDSISRGIISHTERFASGLTPYLQTDAAINPGNSGGALFNHAGEVIGMNTAIASTKAGANVGIGYAVPIDLVKKVTAQLRIGPPSWGDAGLASIVSSLTPDEAEIFKVPDGHAAIIVTKDPLQGPSAGKLKARDVIYKINDVGVTAAVHAMRTIASYEKDDTIVLEVMRNGKSETVDITLEEGWTAGEEQLAEFYEGHLGMTLEMWTDESNERGTFTSPVITKVQSLGPAHKAHIASSQRNVGFRGPYMVSFQLDVKTVSGAVYDGEYVPVSTPGEMERLAEKAYKETSPLLLEIQLWARNSPMDLETPLNHLGTAFYKVDPSLAAALAAGDENESFESAYIESEYHAETGAGHSIHPARQD